MTLAASGYISTGGATANRSIASELGVGTVTFPDASTRTLTGKGSGSLILPNDFWGKSNSSVGFQYSTQFISSNQAPVEADTYVEFYWNPDGTAGDNWTQIFSNPIHTYPDPPSNTSYWATPIGDGLAWDIRVICSTLGRSSAARTYAEFSGGPVYNGGTTAWRNLDLGAYLRVGLYANALEEDFIYINCTVQLAPAGTGSVYASATFNLDIGAI